MKNVLELDSSNSIVNNFRVCTFIWASLVAQLVKNPPAMQETCVRCMDWKDSPGEGTLFLLATKVY